MKAAISDRNRIDQEIRGEEFKAMAFLLRPELARQIWPPEEQIADELPENPERLSAEQVEAALREYGFAVIPD